MLRRLPARVFRCSQWAATRSGAEARQPDRRRPPRGSVDQPRLAGDDGRTGLDDAHELRYRHPPEVRPVIAPQAFTPEARDGVGRQEPDGCPTGRTGDQKYPHHADDNQGHAFDRLDGEQSSADQAIRDTVRRVVTQADRRRVAMTTTGGGAPEAAERKKPRDRHGEHIEQTGQRRP